MSEQRGGGQYDGNRRHERRSVKDKVERRGGKKLGSVNCFLLERDITWGGWGSQE